MPKESEIVKEIPKSLLGEFCVIRFEEYAVGGYVKTISKISDNRYLIERTEVVFLDSLNWVNRNMSPIRKVNLVNNYLEIVTEDKVYTMAIADTLSSKPKRKEYVLDFDKGFLYDEFYDNELSEESKRKVQLRLNNGVYYLNIEYFKKYWMIVRIAKNGKNLILNATNFSLLDESEIEFEKLKSKYNFEKIKFEKNREIDWRYYLANPNNNELERILDEDFFEGVTWYRINRIDKNWIPLSIGLIILTSLIFYFRRIKKRKTTENKA